MTSIYGPSLFDPSRSLSAIAADQGVRFTELLNPTVQRGFTAASARFDERMAQLANFVRFTAPRVLPPGELVQAPPLPLAEVEEPPLVNVEEGGTSPSNPLRTLGGSLQKSIQSLSNTSADSVAAALVDMGDWLADGVEETVTDALENITFTAGQKDGAVFSAANFAALWAKQAALRNAAGSWGPQVTTMVCAPAIVPLFYSVYHSGLPGLKVIPLRTLAAGRYYLAPEVGHSPILLTAEPKLGTSYVGFAGDSTASITMHMAAYVAATPNLRYATDGVTPRWLVKGGV